MNGRRAVSTALGLLASALLLMGCADPDAVEAPTDTDPTVPAETTAAPPPEPSTDPAAPETTEPTTAAASAEPAAVTGPQTCGTVTTVIDQEAVVEILAGDVDCAFAEALLNTYYHDPPNPPEGSGAYVTIDDWECNSSSSQEPGRFSTCRGPDDALVVTTAAASDGVDGDGAPGPVCALIDQPTLDQIFPDGRYDEDLCQSFIDGEA